MGTAQEALLFFFLEKLGVIRTEFHRVDWNGVWELPTKRVVPGASSSTNTFCYTWRPNR